MSRFTQVAPSSRYNPSNPLNIAGQHMATGTGYQPLGPNLGSGTPVSPSSKTLAGYDFPGSGGGYKTIVKGPSMASATDCTNACDQDLKCMIWAYDKSNGSCYFKDQYDLADLDSINVAQAKQFLSGPSKRYLNQFENKQMMSWPNIAMADQGTAWQHQFKTPNVEFCENVARFTPGIDGFEWNSKTQVCKLRNGQVGSLSWDPSAVSGGFYTTTDPKLQHWFQTVYPKLQSDFANWYKNKWPGEEQTFETWIKNNYPQQLAAFQAWKAKMAGNVGNWEDDYEQFIVWMQTKYPSYKAAYEKLKNVAGKIPPGNRNQIEDFVAWLYHENPQLADRIVDDAEALYTYLKKWIAIVLGKIASARGSAGGPVLGSGSSNGSTGVSSNGGVTISGSVPVNPPVVPVVPPSQPIQPPMNPVTPLAPSSPAGFSQYLY